MRLERLVWMKPSSLSARLTKSLTSSMKSRSSLLSLDVSLS